MSATWQLVARGSLPAVGDVVALRTSEAGALSLATGDTLHSFVAIYGDAQLLEWRAATEAECADFRGECARLEGR